MTQFSAPQLSFEFFPPRNEEQEALFTRARDQLAQLGPEYMSVTFGAGGSTRKRTYDTVLNIQRETGVAAAPHISCMADSEESIMELLAGYREAGIRRLVVLRGDRPSGGGGGTFEYAADLVRFIREHFGGTFFIEVACYPEYHPESDSPEMDLTHFKEKVEAGADGAITQYFFNPDAYFRLLDDCEAMGIDVPIVPGIMPVTNYTRLARFSNMCGAEIPQWIAKRLAAYGDNSPALLDFGEQVVSDLCRKLLQGGAPGIHFYTLNRARATLKLCRNLGLGQPAAALTGVPRPA